MGRQGQSFGFWDVKGELDLFDLDVRLVGLSVLREVTLDEKHREQSGGALIVLFVFVERSLIDRFDQLGDRMKARVLNSCGEFWIAPFPVVYCPRGDPRLAR